MKKLTYVMAQWCPYCKMATRWLNTLMNEDERFKDIDIDVVDIDADPQRAAEYPHELVPNFWIDGKKVFEGVPSKPIIRDIIEKTLES